MNRICFVSKALIVSQKWTFCCLCFPSNPETVTLRYHGSAKANAHASYHVYLAEERDDKGVLSRVYIACSTEL